jgi:hypothetical protein
VSNIYIRQYLDIVNEANVEIDERANFQADERTERAFEILMQFLGFHESSMTPTWRKLAQNGVFERHIDPRNPINKYTPEQWQRVQAAIGNYFRVEFADSVLTISAA